MLDDEQQRLGVEGRREVRVSRRVKPDVTQVRAEILEHGEAGVDLCAERAIIAVQAASHPGVLGALTREQPPDAACRLWPWT